MIATLTTSQNCRQKNWFFIIIVVVMKEHNYRDQINTNWINNWGFHHDIIVGVSSPK
jgi:hypothetical protein